MRLAGRLEQNEQPGGFAERDLGVFQAASGASIKGMIFLEVFFKLQIPIVKLRVDERGAIVEQGRLRGEVDE